MYPCGILSRGKSRANELASLRRDVGLPMSPDEASVVADDGHRRAPSRSPRGAPLVHEALDVLEPSATAVLPLVEGAVALALRARVVVGVARRHPAGVEE